jgi:hypothetical protein
MKVKILSGVRLGGESVKPGTVAEVADIVGYDLIQRAKAEAVLETQPVEPEPESPSEKKKAK